MGQRKKNIPTDLTDNHRFLYSLSYLVNPCNLGATKEIMTDNEITYKIRGAIFNVYNELGPGLLESIYEAALVYELKKAGLSVQSQVPLKVIYDNRILPVDYRLDILVEDRVIIELKSVEEMKKLFHKQLLTYMKIANKRIGILVNFNTDDITSNIIRKII